MNVNLCYSLQNDNHPDRWETSQIAAVGHEWPGPILYHYPILL